MPTNRICSLVAVIVLALAATNPIAHAQTYVDLYNFGTKSGDPLPAETQNTLVQGRDGNLYGTASAGGAQGFGAVFKITPGGTLTVLHSFTANEGQYPASELTLGTGGSFYGTTQLGGTGGCLGLGCGTVFRITPSGNLTTLYNFTGGDDGAYPSAPPIQATDGNFYGTTEYGGMTGLCPGGFTGCGGIYKMTPSGTITVLHEFDVTDGESPTGGLVQADDGKFYGVTQWGGVHSAGVGFSITAGGKYVVLNSFKDDPGGPLNTLVLGSDGNFYGTCEGGASSDGAAYKMDVKGNATTMASFGNKSGGGRNGAPFAGLIQGTDGDLYGVTSSNGGVSNGPGVIYRITPERVYSFLYVFTLAGGYDAFVKPIQHTNGLLYGETTYGGDLSCGLNGLGCGTFYSFDVGLAPFVSLVSTSGKIGKTIGILGQGFTGTTGVSFNGTSAAFTVKSDTYLTATVPSGATTGSVTVATPGGTLVSNKQFRVN
jgi:uncharacterized repeat protein (TIGR03803 family)